MESRPPGADGSELPPLKRKIVNKIGMEFMLVPGGRFVMGVDPVADDPSDHDAVRTAVTQAQQDPHFSWYDFAPRHEVEVQPFYMGRHPVTQRQFTAVMGVNKATFKDGWDYPIESVSWYDAQKFIEKLNEMMDTDAHRLPTEAEWEFCCRGGVDADFCFEGRVNRLEHYAWYTNNTRFRPRPVGQKRPNKYGLFDMHGLVWEWTASKAWPYPYQHGDGRDAPDDADPRVVRGGSFLSDPHFCRCGFRDWHLPVHRDHDLGFRVAVR
jgi:formylglycine-generating enzyme required for sulfatase activity